jgi:methylglutaconyl-CoA hydratase
VPGLEISDVEGVLDVVMGEGGDNLLDFEDCLSLTALLCEPPATAHLLRLRARGPNFCLGRVRGGSTPDELGTEARRLVALNEALGSTDLVVVAEVQGPAAGFGVGLAALADVAVASPEATFRFPEADLGLAPAVVLAWLPRLVGERTAFDLTATARTFDAVEAHRLGIVTTLSPTHDELQAHVDTYVAMLTKRSRRVHREIKAFLRVTRDLGRSQAAEMAVDRLTIGALRAAAGDPPKS